VLLVGAHLTIFRHNGPAGPVVDDPRKLRPGRFWPDQMFMDGFASFIVFIIILLLAAFAPPYLDAKADPTNALFTPYPAWYFLFLFGLLNFVPWLFGHIPFLASQANAPWVEMLAAIVVPTIALIVIFLLPWLDRSTTRSFGNRGKILWPTFFIIVAIVALTIYAQIGIQAKEAAGPPSAPEAQVLAAPAEAATTSGAAANPALAAGAKIFAANCSGCHGANGLGSPSVAPPLAGNPFVTGDPHQVIKVVSDGLKGETIMGQTYGAPMPAWKGTLSKSDLAAVISYIRGGLGSNSASPVSASQIK
jgi:mono/diheme cytochrome c family protein